jgi:hypothetical protein
VYGCSKKKNTFISGSLNVLLACFTQQGFSKSSYPSTFHIGKKFVDFAQGFEKAKMRQALTGGFSLFA